MFFDENKRRLSTKNFKQLQNKIRLKTNFKRFEHRERRKFFFLKKKHNFIFRLNDVINDYVFVFCCFCVSNVVVKNVLKTIHNNFNDYSKYVKCYERIFLT